MKVKATPKHLHFYNSSKKCHRVDLENQHRQLFFFFFEPAASARALIYWVVVEAAYTVLEAEHYNVQM